MFRNDARSKHFINNIRTYNMIFNFTSMGEKIDYSINKGKGHYVFRKQGANFYQIGDLLLKPGNVPNIYDT